MRANVFRLSTAYETVAELHIIDCVLRK